MYNSSELIKKLFSMQDIQYKNFHSRLMPTVDPDNIIGIRTPQLRRFAKDFGKDEYTSDFLQQLPHRYYEENNLHAFLIEQIKDPDRCIEQLELFLPHVDNWATCDMMSPKVFAAYPEKALAAALNWINRTDTYTVRFGIKLLMDHFLDERFDVSLVERVAALRSDEYYINMMIAWYFATALAKQFDTVLPYIKEKRLSEWTHNKTIQKACESYRLTDNQKQALKLLKL